DPHAMAIAPMRLDGFRSSPSARITRVGGGNDRIEIDVEGPALVMVNASYFRAWGDNTLPLDLDRLGVLAPAGASKIVLRFGRHRGWVIAAWVMSYLALLLSAFCLLTFQKLDRRAGEVERTGDDDRPLR